MFVAMAAVKQSPSDVVSFVSNTITYDRITATAMKAFDEIETDQESYGSSEDLESCSPTSVVVKVKKWLAVAKDGRVHSQIMRIRAEDSHLGEDIGECLISKVVGTGAGYDHLDVMIFSRPASPLSKRCTE